jgi:hypothetical protein
VVYLLPMLLFRRNPAMSWCALWLIAGVGFVFVLDLVLSTQALLYLRFTLIASPAVYLLLASLPLRPGFRDLLPLAAVVACLMWLPDAYGATWKGQWRELGNDVKRVARADDLVIFAAPNNAFLLNPPDLYGGVEYYANPIPCRVLLLDRPVDARLFNDLQTFHHVWLVTLESSRPPREYLPGWHFVRAAPNRLFAGALWQAAPPPL